MRSESSCLRYRGERRALGFRPSSDESASHANRLKFFVHAAVGIQRCPAVRILKEANAANLPVRAEIEPMQRAARNTDQVSGFHFDSDNGRRFGIHMEEPAT